MRGMLLRFALSDRRDVGRTYFCVAVTATIELKLLLRTFRNYCRRFPTSQNVISVVMTLMIYSYVVTRGVYCPLSLHCKITCYLTLVYGQFDTYRSQDNPDPEHAVFTAMA
jgi:hypothetical protein